jgi:hypothetical protein
MFIREALRLEFGTIRRVAGRVKQHDALRGGITRC